MSGIKYSKKQIQDLKNNKYVKNATQRSITFSTEFKYEVLKLSEKWIFYTEIFKKLWFPEYIINSKIPERSYHRWKYKSDKWVIEEKKWRPTKKKIDYANLTNEEKIEYLETENAYLKELNKIKFWHYP